MTDTEAAKRLDDLAHELRGAEGEFGSKLRGLLHRFIIDLKLVGERCGYDSLPEPSCSDVCFGPCGCTGYALIYWLEMPPTVIGGE